MKLYLIAALAIITLSGCGEMPDMTNDKIIREVKKCSDAGLDAVRYEGGISGTTKKIECHPKETK